MKILKQQFEKDPYSLSSEELMAIKLYDMKLKEKFKKWMISEWRSFHASLHIIQVRLRPVQWNYYIGWLNRGKCILF